MHALLFSMKTSQNMAISFFDYIAWIANIFALLLVQFLIANCSIILFHYDGNVDEWRDLDWSDRAIHILAHNQTKW